MVCDPLACLCAAALARIHAFEGELYEPREAIAHVVPSPAAAPAERPRPWPRLRWGIGGSIGFVYPIDTVITHPDGSQSSVFSAGIGLDLRGGVQLTEWLAFDLNAVAETIVLAGDARVGALFEVAPVDAFAVSLGGGVGSLYDINFFFANPSADFAVGLLRVEGRIQTGAAGDQLMSFGAEGQLGGALGGDAAPGTLVTGGRAVVGLLWR